MGPIRARGAKAPLPRFARALFAPRTRTAQFERHADQAMRMLKILTLALAVAARASGAVQSAPKSADSVESAIVNYENDLRAPSLSNISGAWSPNPIAMGALTYFTLTQAEDLVAGLAFTRGCMMTSSSLITGRRTGSALTLKFTSKIGDEDHTFTREFTIITYRGEPALAIKGGSDNFPMVPRMKAKVLEPVIRKELIEAEKKSN